MSASFLRIGVDVGGTFTDLVAFDGQSLYVVKIPSTPPGFQHAVIDAVAEATRSVPGDKGEHIAIVHGSTVATNALLERQGEPVAFITTEGFRDLLLIGRQNRPQLYALQVSRPIPATEDANWFTVTERLDSRGMVVTPIDPAQVDRVIVEVMARGLRHVAVCLIDSYVNSVHEKVIAERCRKAGLTVSLSSEVLPEFREYERASTTVINAALGPLVEKYLLALRVGLASSVNGSPGVAGLPDADRPIAGLASSLEIMSSTGGTLSVAEASVSAARLVLSGPAGGVMGALLIARAAGVDHAITYDMGGTSTDVATIVAGQPQWTTSSVVDGLPIGLPSLDIHTVGAGGGSIAYLDAGGALRVGPRSAGALPGPACYGRGGIEPTVTDANLLLGRLRAEGFAGGKLRLDLSAARRAMEPLADRIQKSIEQTAEGIIRIAEESMSRAVRAMTSRRGLDPKDFALISFGGAGGLHAAAVAEALDIRTVLVPPYAGVLSALGMVAAPGVADASKTVVHLGEQLDDHRLYAEYGHLNMLAAEKLPNDLLASVEAYADVRFKGQSYELTVRARGADRSQIEQAFVENYASRYGQAPAGRPIEIVTLRIRRIGRVIPVALPTIEPDPAPAAAGGLSRRQLLALGSQPGPLSLLDAEATAYVPRGWTARCDDHGIVWLEKGN